jgi:ABC-type phosphate/phosphonate transport system substrate-binding protein
LLRFASFLAPNIAPTYAAVAEAVGRRLGETTELEVGRDYEELRDGRADVAFLCGLPYVHLADEPQPWVEALAAPVLTGERYGGRPIYFSDVIVAADASRGSFASLRGASWAFNEPDSQSGFGVTRARLAALGATSGFFASVVEAGFHQRAIRLVADGEVDASAIDSQVLAVELRDDPSLAARVRVIDALGPSTIQPVVAATRLPADLRRAIRAALVEVHTDPATAAPLAQGLVERFVPVTDGDYDDIRTMEAAADAAGLEGLGTPAEPHPPTWRTPPDGG